MCRQTKSADNDSTTQERRHRLPDDDASTSPYQSPALLSSGTSDAEGRSTATWHTPRCSPPPSTAVLDDSAARPTPAVTSNGDVSSVGIPDEMTSYDVTATAAEQIPQARLQSDVDRGMSVTFDGLICAIDLSRSAIGRSLVRGPIHRLCKCDVH